MADLSADASPWLSVIGRSLAYLCLEQARQRDPDKIKNVLPKVDFLMALGLSEKDAAAASGTNHQSVRVLRRHHGRKKPNGKKAKKRR